MNNEHIWTSASTDITLRWKRLYGYVPASETPETQEKWRKWKEMLSREIPDVASQQYKKLITKTGKTHA
jgi:hypothetical protein